MDPEKIFFFDMEQNDTFAFSMCNPPFYASQEEIEQGLLNKELEPSAVSLLLIIHTDYDLCAVVIGMHWFKQ